MPPPAAREPLLTRPFLLCALANLVQGLAFHMFLHFPGFLHGIGANDVEIGLIFGITGATAIASRPAIGRAMDARGRRGVILLGGVLNVAAIGLHLTVEAVGPWVVVLRILHGLAEGMLFTGLFTYGADCVPADRRTQGLALFGVSGMLPISLGGLLGEVALAHGGYARLFLTSTAFAALSLVLSWPLRDLPRRREGDAGELDDGLARGFRASLLQRDLRPLWWVTLVFTVALASVFTFLKRFADETGLGSVGSFFTAYAAIAIALRVGLGWLPDRIGPKRVLLPALAALATACLLLATARGPLQVVVAGLCFGVGHGFTFPILFGMVVTRARSADRGSAMGIFTALFDLGVLLGGPLFGAVLTVRGFAGMYGAAAAVVAVGAAVFVVWDARVRRRAAAAPRDVRGAPGV